ncbi:hypothetical protein [Pseudomonas cichorii]|uniref:hypothetical protein n=1 Tax=Pseudomonas cichorii TaxID=36746 RepID=UPI001C8A097C|nr:hypothetical protein [Pseudomonas cichorii]MBX8484034.1 hypothetical protein [Pseudomonas cichorii]
MMEFFDEQGEPAATISFADIKALSPLTENPEKTLEKLGIDDERLTQVLTKLHKIANSR